MRGPRLYRPRSGFRPGWSRNGETLKHSPVLAVKSVGVLSMRRRLPILDAAQVVEWVRGEGDRNWVFVDRECFDTLRSGIASRNILPNNMNEHVVKANYVTFRNSQGVELRAQLVRLTRHHVVMELYNPHAALRLSEVLTEFKITLSDGHCYSGRGVIRNIIQAGLTFVCDVTLEENAWQDVEVTSVVSRNGNLARQFGSFIEEWQKLYRIGMDYKVIVADMQTFFNELRLWSDQVELGIRSSVHMDRAWVVHETAIELSQVVIPMLNTLFEKFEPIACKMDSDEASTHASYMRQQLHPLVMPAPFAYRTFHKPLGYAGDHEMINMIARNGFEGDSLYAKVINRWFIYRPPAIAHRNRIVCLAQKLWDESARAARSGRRARIFNLGCGPAWEVQKFLAQHDLSSNVDFLMLDFNEEALQCVQDALAKIKQQRHRNIGLQFVKKSVHQMLKEAAKSAEDNRRNYYDLVYCAGLFDYLSDQVCRRLTNIMYDLLAPGGLLLVTNVVPANPSRHGMEHLLDWHLNYRRADDLAALKPDGVTADEAQVYTDDTGVNVFLEVRKPAYA
jgi:extracellular factor (EF) 3-hydroxypalmitic acid methyl ester biosynthesis protein